MSDLRALAHLEEQLGEERWQALINSVNTGKIMKFCEDLVASMIVMTIGGRNYDLLTLQGESGDDMVTCAKNAGAHSGKWEREHFLKHQKEIPANLRELIFVFTDDHPVGGNSEDVCFVHWSEGHWVGYWDYQREDYKGVFRFPRRKS